jgi:addiction module HigA family antidote
MTQRSQSSISATKIITERTTVPVGSYRLKSPPHVGGFIKSEIVVPTGLSVTAAAEVLGATRAALSALLNQRASLSPEMALRIEKAFAVSMDTLVRMQNSYDIAQARRKVGEINVAPYLHKPTLEHDLL